MLHEKKKKVGLIFVHLLSLILQYMIRCTKEMNVTGLLKRSALLLLFITAFSTICFGQTDRYIDALEFYQNKDYSKAKTLFLEEISQNPDNDAAYYYLALICTTSENTFPQAEAYFKKALEKAPDNYWYKYYLAMFYQQTDRVELTSSLLEELIAKFPKKYDLYYDIINAYFSQNEVDKALEVMDKLEAKGGKNETFGLTRMNIIISKNKGDEKEAYRFLEDYYKECQTPRIASLLGDYYVRNFNDSLALDYYDQALDLNSDYTPAYYGKAHIYQNLRQYDNYFDNISFFLKDKQLAPAAKAEYLNSLLESPQFVLAFLPEVDSMMMEAHDTHPTDSTLNSLLGMYYYQTERPYLTIELFRQNQELYPQSRTAAIQYASVLYSTNAWDLLKESCDTLLMRFPKDVDIIQMRAISKFQTQDTLGAVDDYILLTKLAPKDSAITIFANSSLGDMYMLLTQYKKAFKCYDKVLKVNPDYAPVLNNYAYYLSELNKDLSKALKMSKKTILQEPDNPTYLDTYAWILHLLDLDLEAKASFKHAMLYGGKESAVIMDHYAEVLYSLKEYDLAYIYWEQAKALDNTLGIAEKIQLRKQQQK